MLMTMRDPLPIPSKSSNGSRVDDAVSQAMQRNRATHRLRMAEKQNFHRIPMTLVSPLPIPVKPSPGAMVDNTVSQAMQRNQVMYQRWIASHRRHPRVMEVNLRVLPTPTRHQPSAAIDNRVRQVYAGKRQRYGGVGSVVPPPSAAFPPSQMGPRPFGPPGAPVFMPPPIIPGAPPAPLMSPEDLAEFRRRNPDFFRDGADHDIVEAEDEEAPAPAPAPEPEPEPAPPPAEQPDEEFVPEQQVEEEIPPPPPDRPDEQESGPFVPQDDGGEPIPMPPPPPPSSSSSSSSSAFDLSQFEEKGSIAPRSFPRSPFANQAFYQPPIPQPENAPIPESLVPSQAVVDPRMYNPSHDEVVRVMHEISKSVSPFMKPYVGEVLKTTFHAIAYAPSIEIQEELLGAAMESIPATVRPLFETYASTPAKVNFFRQEVKQLATKEFANRTAPIKILESIQMSKDAEEHEWVQSVAPEGSFTRDVIGIMEGGWEKAYSFIEPYVGVGHRTNFVFEERKFVEDELDGRYSGILTPEDMQAVAREATGQSIYDVNGHTPKMTSFLRAFAAEHQFKLSSLAVLAAIPVATGAVTLSAVTAGIATGLKATAAFMAKPFVAIGTASYAAFMQSMNLAIAASKAAAAAATKFLETATRFSYQAGLKYGPAAARGTWKAASAMGGGVKSAFTWWINRSVWGKAFYPYAAYTVPRTLYRFATQNTTLFNATYQTVKEDAVAAGKWTGDLLWEWIKNHPYTVGIIAAVCLAYFVRRYYVDRRTDRRLDQVMAAVNRLGDAQGRQIAAGVDEKHNAGEEVKKAAEDFTEKFLESKEAPVPGYKFGLVELDRCFRKCTKTHQGLVELDRCFRGCVKSSKK